MSIDIETEWSEFVSRPETVGRFGRGRRDRVGQIDLVRSAFFAGAEARRRMEVESVLLHDRKLDEG